MRTVRTAHHDEKATTARRIPKATARVPPAPFKDSNLKAGVPNANRSNCTPRRESHYCSTDSEGDCSCTPRPLQRQQLKGGGTQCEPFELHTTTRKPLLLDGF